MKPKNKIQIHEYLVKNNGCNNFTSLSHLQTWVCLIDQLQQALVNLCFLFSFVQAVISLHLRQQQLNALTAFLKLNRLPPAGPSIPQAFF